MAEGFSHPDIHRLVICTAGVLGSILNQLTRIQRTTLSSSGALKRTEHLVLRMTRKSVLLAACVKDPWAVGNRRGGSGEVYPTAFNKIDRYSPLHHNMKTFSSVQFSPFTDWFV